MPACSYSLTLDGGPLAELSSKIFEEVKHDVACQLALDCFLQQRQSRLPPLQYWTWQSCYLSEVMPEALKDLMKDESSFIHCNFDTGDMWDEEEILHRLTERGIGLGACDVCYRFREFTCDIGSDTRLDSDCYIEPAPPLPSWYDIRFSQILPIIPEKRRAKRQPVKSIALNVGYEPPRRRRR